MSKPVCVVVGVGPGNGAAIARRFHASGYTVALLARSTELTSKLAQELEGAKAYACDVTSEASMNEAFAAIAKDMPPIDVLVYNAGSGVFGTIEDVAAKNAPSAFVRHAASKSFAAKHVVGPMKKAGHGAIVFIGATASRRGNVKTVAFAPAKAAQRSLAESMARALWPAGIHVALVIVDGVVDLPRTRKAMPDKPDTFFVKPADIAETVLAIALQPRSVWSFEVEARPFGETW